MRDVGWGRYQDDKTIPGRDHDFHAYFSAWFPVLGGSSWMSPQDATCGVNVNHPYLSSAKHHLRVTTLSSAWLDSLSHKRDVIVFPPKNL